MSTIWTFPVSSAAPAPDSYLRMSSDGTQIVGATANFVQVVAKGQTSVPNVLNYVAAPNAMSVMANIPVTDMLNTDVFVFSFGANPTNLGGLVLFPRWQAATNVQLFAYNASSTPLTVASVPMVWMVLR